MKIAISSASKDLDSQVDQRFVKVPYFVIYDLEDDSYQVVYNNRNPQAVQGSVIQSARTVAETGAQAVITGNVGPKAYQALKAAGIQVYLTKGGTVREAVESFKRGKLKRGRESKYRGTPGPKNLERWAR